MAAIRKKSTLNLGPARAAFLLTASAFCLFGCTDLAVMRPAVTPVAEGTVKAKAEKACPDAQSSATLYLKCVTDRKFGTLAHVFGHSDGVESRVVPDPRKSWWDNPPVLYAEDDIVSPDVTAQADAATFRANAASSNVTISASFTCHAVLALKTAPPSDCLKGTITGRLTGLSRYYDDGWTDVLDLRAREVTFAFDTSRPDRRLIATKTVRRPIRVVMECYRRGHDKWEGRTQWPRSPRSGDQQSVFTVEDAVLTVTGYTYAPAAGSVATAP